MADTVRPMLSEFHKTGTGKRPRTPVAARFERLSTPEPMSGCTLWLGQLDWSGYGRFRIKKGYEVGAHRVAYELARGAISPGYVLDHLCRNRACVNPAHLEPVMQRENVRRGLLGKHCRTCVCG